MDEKLCLMKHEQIDEKLEGHDDMLKDHDVRIGTLEKSDAVHSTQIDSLCKKLDNQTNAIWGLVIVLLTTLIANFFTR
jgi:ABC-type uncharacterized transport system substrate-binding protein